MLNYKLTPIIDRFVFTCATLAVAIGPQGEGKTFAAIIAMLVHAQKWLKHQKNIWGGNVDSIEKMHGCLIRDSHENIKRHTIKSIHSVLKNNVEFYDDMRRMRSNLFDIELIGVPDYTALAKVQFGPEWTFGWLEEPAPMIERGSAGIMKEAYEAVLARCARQKYAIPRIQVTMNPPEEEHWTYTEFYERPRFPFVADAKEGEQSMLVVQIPYGDNKHLTREQRNMVEAGYKFHPALYQRFVKGLPAFTSLGEAVTPGYNEEIHRTKPDIRLDPKPGSPVFRFWDGWMNPTCIFMQIQPNGRWFFLDTLRGANIGVKQLIRNDVKPLIAQRYYEIDQWRDIGDPSMADPDQSNSESSAARTIEDELKTRFEPGHKWWNPRREAMNQALNWMIDGEPMILLSYHEGILHRALRGGWHYYKDNSGRVIKDKPVKDIHSHPGDAFSYGIEKIFGYQGIGYEDAARFEKIERELAISYA